MNLHDWVDELCDVLDLEHEADEALVLDLARVVAHQVARPGAPLTAYLLGVAVGRLDADPDTVEAMAERVRALAESWDRPAGAGGEEDVEVPDDSAIDHSLDVAEP